MPPLTATILRKQLAAGETDPLYMLVGADDLEKSAVASEFADMVEEDLRASTLSVSMVGRRRSTR